jgi:hypothetical protein
VYALIWGHHECLLQAVAAARHGSTMSWSAAATACRKMLMLGGGGWLSTDHRCLAGLTVPDIVWHIQLACAAARLCVATCEPVCCVSTSVASISV